MALMLTNKSKIFFTVTIITLSGVLGFLVWRVNQPDTVAPTESEAGGELPPPPPGGGVPMEQYPCECCDGETVKVDIENDGSIPWYIDWKTTCETACENGHDEWKPTSPDNCGEPVTECDCVAWGSVGRSCGYFCQFPAGTQAAVDAKAKETCSPQVAMCKFVSNGTNQVVIEEYDSSHVCYEKLDQCQNPYSDDKCVEVEAVCGDGKVDEGESCDPDALPTGCTTGYTCEDDCTCSAPSRPSLCGSTTISTTSVTDNASIIMTSQTSGDTANYFTYAVYNMDNLYSANNPKPVCVPGSVTWEHNCPVGTMPLILSDPSTATRTSGTVTFKTEDVFVNDYFWNNQKVDSVKISAYFLKTGGLISLPDTNCQEYLTYNAPAVVPEPEVEPEIEPQPGVTTPQTGILDSLIGKFVVGILFILLGKAVYTLPNYLFLSNSKEDGYIKSRERFERKASKLES